MGIMRFMQNINKKTKNRLFLMTTGIVSGLINGFFGGGGGMIVVPFLSYLVGYDEKESHATAILIILPLSILSGILYSTFGNADFSLLLPVAVGVTAGGVIGAILLKKIKNKIVSIIFGAVMLVAGIFMIIG